MSGHARSRLFLNGRHAGGEDPSIVIEKILPFHAEVIQITAHFSAPVITFGNITLHKISVLGLDYSVLLDTFDPLATSTIDVVCNMSWQYRKDDTLRLSYDNPDDRVVGFEVVLREGN